MDQKYYFKDAKWIGAAERSSNTFSILRGHFELKAPQKVSLNVLGLGFFKCYINGICINPDTFLPLSSDYEAGCDPKDELLSAHRIYVPSFDITPYVTEGDNVIALHYGGGWYTCNVRAFGLPKAIYSITAEGEGEAMIFGSDSRCRIGKSYIKSYNLITHETHDYSEFTDCFGREFDDKAWPFAIETEAPDTEYCSSDCPPDRLIEGRACQKLGNGDAGIIYDCGENTVGAPVLQLEAPAGEAITVIFAEELSPDGKLDPDHIHRQKFEIVSDGKNRMVQPEFTWFGFRYLEIIGAATLKCVKVIHADVGVCSSFDCDNETLNWIYKTFVHTMLCNMHTGHPSDCPHLERRGYTGDGQVTCHAVFTTLDAKAFYKKWLQDIADTQDQISGHIQNAAPYIRSGGGPGGWGCAIVEVPYQYYRHFGDKEILKKYYGNMRRYIDYLELHTEFGLVTTDKPGEWCLGDWCCPIIVYPEKDISYFNQQVVLPAAMVNTYFMVKSLLQMAEIARIIGKEEDIAEYTEKAEQRKRAIQAAYFNAFDGNFLLNAHGANAYAVDLGLGNQKTYPNMVDYYSKLGHLDTGIFGTDILTRVLFENGDAELAVELLTNNGPQGFEHWRQNGATTFHEYWDSTRSRSHSHPMFGAVTAYLFEHLLGIGQPKGSAGYTNLRIEPKAISKFNRMSGSFKIPAGEVALSYEKRAGKAAFRIVIPKGVAAVFCCGGEERSLAEGENLFEISLTIE